MERAEAEAILDGDRETAVALLMRVGELVEANRRLEARVAELEQRLNRSSRNSSLPPSLDPPSAPPRPREPGSGRERGGQPGHEGKSRPLLPLERVDEVVEHWPERCRACAHSFGEEERFDAAAPQRHQVAELPPIAVTVTEHRLHRLRCPACAAETRAELPAEVPRGAFGPRLQAAVATLAVRNRVSRRDTVELTGELFGAELCTGSIDAIVQHRRGARTAAGTAARPDPLRLRGQHRRDRLAPTRRQAHALGRAHADRGRLPDRPRPARAAGQGAAGRGLPRHRLLRSLVGLRLPRPRTTPTLLGTPR
jgi:hypothetical protein